ncbi:hypothetical protein [[Flexibacter] sp. ATCC 35208]|uniref:hypothetical protein n=1 Tax=[Flexibacter] sp. ATCC 35208 TaxID=1936242 RepID=UPI0009D4B750|nr:hypothetical protein [[Flexibacter] sp. ATCC 35208]OMP76274.1 hypothetical protein BW716_25690 [[Flexibacter] sp. ATCC 35208]
MAIQVDRLKEILDRSRDEGRLETMDTPDALAARNVINEYAEVVKREYLEKERLSIIAASQFVVTA